MTFALLCKSFPNLITHDNHFPWCRDPNANRALPNPRDHDVNRFVARHFDRHALVDFQSEQ
jgi:hypothetical protein